MPSFGLLIHFQVLALKRLVTAFPMVTSCCILIFSFSYLIFRLLMLVHGDKQLLWMGFLRRCTFPVIFQGVSCSRVTDHPFQQFNLAKYTEMLIFKKEIHSHK